MLNVHCSIVKVCYIPCQTLKYSSSTLQIHENKAWATVKYAQGQIVLTMSLWMACSSFLELLGGGLRSKAGGDASISGWSNGTGEFSYIIFFVSAVY